MKKITIIILTAATLFICMCGKHKHERDNAQGVPATGEKEIASIYLSGESLRSIGIQTAIVGQRENRSFLKAMGKVIIPLDRQAIISYAFPARVAEGHVNPGDRVEKGQPLVTLESEEVGNAMCEFYKATADFEHTRLNLEREQRLFENGVAPKKNFLAAETDYKIARSNQDAAEKKLHVLGFTEKQVQQIAHSHQVSPRITLYSPITGKVVSSRLVRGMMTEPSTEILVIVDLSKLWIDAEIYEKDIAYIKIGQKVEIHIPAYPAALFKGSLGYISDSINEETRTITVRVELQNRDAMLKPGLFADLHIFFNGNRKILAVPADAVIEEGEEKIVFVQIGDRFHKRRIVTGSQDEGVWEVLSGLKTGERVVTQGVLHLKSLLTEELRESAHIH
ncbi:MAG TPA: efflux RND transporter periplasmic adaptor subunit [Patescibacteria group bacterium]|nr:efflux RND transporter periplasmic adaptor subunit [Patescibacteria group bacterium]